MDPNQPPIPGTAIRQPTAREFLAIVFRRKLLIAGLFTATTLTVLVIALLTPNLYESVGRVLVKRGEQQSTLEPYRQVVNDWEADLASELEIAKSDPVLVRARQLLRAEAGGTPVVVDPTQVEAQVVGKSTVVAIAYVDRDPKIARRVCDALLRAYIDYRQNTLTLSYSKDFFDTEIANVRDSLARWTESRRQFADENHLADAAEQVRSLLANLRDLEIKRAELASEVTQASAIMDVMRKMQQRPDVDLPALGPNAGLDAMADFKRKVLDQEARVAAIRERYREDSPEVVNALETLNTLQNLLKREVDNRLDVSQSRIDALTSALAGADREIAKRQTMLATMPDKQVKLAVMDQEISVLRLRYEGLSKDGDLARVTQHTTPRVSVWLLSPAGPALSKTAKDYVRLALAPAFSLVIGIGLAFFVDGLDVTVRTSGQAEEAIELPVLATLNERRRVRRASAGGIPHS